MLKRALIGLLTSAALSQGAVAAASADTTVADNGFRPNPNGFSFENYGNDQGYENLTSAEMVKLFGGGVCANRDKAAPIPEPAPAPDNSGGHPGKPKPKPKPGPRPKPEPNDGSDGAGDAAAGPCTLTPPAQRWMDEQNQGMGGGHCNGFAVLSEELYKGQFAPVGSGEPFGYGIKDNQQLQHSIAYAFVYQVLDSVVSQRIKGTPNDILSKLRSALNPSNPETYTLGIYKPDGSGGHAITPFAVVDHGAGRFGVQVYDNNYPNEVREVAFDTNANSWSYNAAINPSVAPELYSGTADNPGIELDPTTPGEGVQPCPFCQGGGAAAAAARRPPRDTVQLLGNRHYHAHLVIRDTSGHQVGVVNGRIVNTFPGASVQPSLALNDYSESQEPAYLIPVRKVGITVDASRLAKPDTESLSDIGAGQDVSISSLKIAHGERDTLTLNNGVKDMTFGAAKGAAPGSPVLRIGADSSKADFALTLKMISLKAGSTIHVKLNVAKQEISFWSTGNKGRATFVLSAIKETRKVNYTEGSVRVHLNGSNHATYSFAK